MNVLFLTLSDFDSIKQRGIYTDLLSKFADSGHNVYVVSPLEKRKQRDTEVIREKNCVILRLKVGDIQKVKNKIKKGISTVMLGKKYVTGIKKYFRDVKFDLVLYSTPPITLLSAIEYVKKKQNAFCYLMLKDIFPQNSVDIHLMSKSGVSGLVYRYFRKKEKKLYCISDKIGCMSPANVKYVLENNPEILPAKVEVCPNTIKNRATVMSDTEKKTMREKYGIPLDKKVFVYGGNLGKPQGVPFLIDCLRSQKSNSDVFFLLVGNGTEYSKICQYIESEKPSNVKLLERLPRDDYDRMIAACDAGMIFLDHRFTIPNFPSRLLSYMQASLPVISCTDPNTDIGDTIIHGNFGWKCESNDVNGFGKCISDALSQDLAALGSNAVKYLDENFTSEITYEIITNAMK